MKRNIWKIASILSLSVPLFFLGQPVSADTLVSVQNYQYRTYQPKPTGATNVAALPIIRENVTTLYRPASTSAKPVTTVTIVHSKPAVATPVSRPNPSASTPVTQAAPATLKLGASGEKVRQLQIMLAFLGYNVTVNGQYDFVTRYAVMLYQHKTARSLTGEADPQTLQAITSAFNQKMALLKQGGNSVHQPAAPLPQKPATAKPIKVTPVVHTKPVMATPVSQSKPIMAIPVSQPKPVPATPVSQPKPANPNVQQPQSSAPSQLTADEKAMVDLINQERTKHGLPQLQVDMQLTGVARVKAQDMVKSGYFSHTSPTYGSPFQMMRSFGITYRAAAENIAQNWSVTGAHLSFMNSSGHRTNILNPSYTHVGIGIVNGGRFGMTFVQMFIQK